MAAKRKSPTPEELAAEQVRMGLLREALGFILPEGQAHRAADALKAGMGCFANMIAAPEAELAKVSGMTPDSARFLHLVLELARASMEEQSGRLRYIMDLDSAADVLRPKFLGRRTEAVAVILLDSSRSLLYSGIVSNGTVTAVPLYIRQLVSLCIDYNADSVILSHNHVSGNATPSQEDMVMTRQVEMALSGIDISLRDHIILAGEEYFSFAASGILDRMAREFTAQRREQLEEARKTPWEYDEEDEYGL